MKWSNAVVYAKSTTDLKKDIFAFQLDEYIYKDSVLHGSIAVTFKYANHILTTPVNIQKNLTKLFDESLERFNYQISDQAYNKLIHKIWREFVSEKTWKYIVHRTFVTKLKVTNEEIETVQKKLEDLLLIRDQLQIITGE